MNSEDRSNFVKLLAHVSELYHKQLTTNLLNIYWESLKSYSFQQIRQACSHHICNVKKGQFMPKPADFIDYLERDDEDKALAAWDKITYAIRTIGTAKCVAFDDPLIHAVICDMGGWHSFGMINQRDVPFVLQEFKKRYQESLKLLPSQIPPYLVGNLGLANSSIKDIELIGNKQKAQKIVLAGMPPSDWVTKLTKY